MTLEPSPCFLTKVVLVGDGGIAAAGALSRGNNISNLSAQNRRVRENGKVAHINKEPRTFSRMYMYARGEKGRANPFGKTVDYAETVH